MTKNRLEFLTDGVFSIVFTLLIIEIHVPEIDHKLLSNGELWQALGEITPLFISYFVSFTVLAMFWIGHHAFYGLIKKEINRIIILINFAYLSLIAFIPFTSSVIGTHPETQLSYVVYGLNIFLIGVINIILLKYAHYSDDIDTKITPRIYMQALLRITITPLLSVLGIAAAFINFQLALFLFTFPILFNIIPGGLDYIEKKFGLNFGEDTLPK